MKAAVKRIKRVIRDETGHGLELVLVLLAVGGLISASLLSYMGSGLAAGEAYETRTGELYAADAGVEDAMWKIQEGEVALCPGVPTYDYSMPDVNNRSVGVTITLVDGFDGPGDLSATYRIESTAASGNDSSTTVTAYTAASSLDFSGIMDYAISSNGNITILQDCLINGDVYIPDEDNLYKKGGTINGTVLNSTEVSVTWPTFDELNRYYWPEVSDLDPGDPTQEITIPTWATSRDNAFTITIGPYLADVENAVYLNIKGGGTDKLWTRLEGTMYVKGNFFLSPNINLDMNGCSIFATGNITLSPTTTLWGSGCIIARENVNFQPELSCEEGQYVLVLAVEGTTTLQPDSDFQGTIAGNVDVQIQPGNELKWVSPYGRGLAFPMGEDEYPLIGAVNIASWEVSTG